MTVTYDHANGDDRGDEIMVVQHGQTLFKGFLKPGGEITFEIQSILHALICSKINLPLNPDDLSIDLE